jgi:HK97 family phage portal protein
MNISFWETFFGVNFNPDDRVINDVNRIFPLSNRVWGVKDAIWIDTNEQWKLYVEIPELRAVVEKRASMMSSNIPCMYDKDGNEVTNHWMVDVINKPNPTQSWSDLVFTLAVQDALFSSAFIYAPKRSMDVRNLFVPVPSDKVQIKTSGKKLKQMDVDGLIDKYVFKYDDEAQETIEIEDMIYLMTNDGMNMIRPVSRLQSLKFPLSNIKAQYKKRNVLLENIGAIGILSSKKNDMGGALPMTPEEKKQIQRDWYRRQKDELIITENEVNWQPMSYPTKDLMLFEELNADKIALIDAFGLSVNLFSSEKGTTFTNVRDSIRMVYQDTIIPETQQMYDAIMQQIGLADEGYYLKAEFHHLPVLADDELAIARAQKTRVEAVEKIVAMGVTLSPDEIRLLSGLENH